MDETKNASETEASQAPADGSNGSSDETRTLSGTADSLPPVETSSDRSDQRSHENRPLPDHPPARPGRIRTRLSRS